jgi:hypothetical protein
LTIDDLNREFAIVGVGNRTIVMQFAPDGSILELWDFENFKKKFCKEFIRVREGETTKVKPLADVWLKHPRGRQYDRLVYAVPGSQVVAGARDYNGWQGFSVEPKVGGWSRNRAHLRDIICSGNDDYFLWVMNWLAALVQMPGRHAWTSIVRDAAVPSHPWFRPADGRVQRTPFWQGLRLRRRVNMGRRSTCCREAEGARHRRHDSDSSQVSQDGR